MTKTSERRPTARARVVRMAGLVTALTVVVTGLGAFTSSALAIPGKGPGTGFYVVGGCDRGDGGADGWTSFDDNTTTLTSFASGCNADGSQWTGLASNTNSTTASTPVGQKAGWTFTAPAGTTIGDAQLWYGGDEDENGWSPFLSDNAGHIADLIGCWGSGTECLPGFDTYSGQDLDSAYGSIAGSTYLSIYTGCASDGGASTCGLNGKDTGNWATLWGSLIQLDDATPPSLSSMQATDSGSTIGFTATESDPVGILSQSLYIDGAVAGSWANSCNFNTPVPCSDPSGLSLSAPASAACHSVYVVVEDSAGNQTKSSPTTICPPSSGSGSGGGTTTTPVTGTSSPSGPLIRHVTFTGYTSGRPALGFAIKRGSGSKYTFSKLVVQLPKGLTWRKAARARSTHRARSRRTGAGKLTITLAKKQRSDTLGFPRGSIAIGHALLKTIRKDQRAGTTFTRVVTLGLEGTKAQGELFKRFRIRL